MGLWKIMQSRFPIQPIGRFVGTCQPVRRPKEIACFSFNSQHDYLQGDSSLRWYYTPQLGADLSKGFDTFEKLDDSKDEHLNGLLASIISYEQEIGKRIDANVVTWRGMMTKILASPFDDREGFEMNSTLYQGCIYIEENHEYKMAYKAYEKQTPRKFGPPSEVMQFWGYKFETLATIPAPWGETSRDLIENRDNEIVSNKEQYCSVVRTGIGETTLCLGGEVDAIWDSKPVEKGAPINWVELKTSAQIRNERDVENFHRKLMKYWIQSFLLGVPKIIVGFRTSAGILADVQEIETQNIPDTVNKRPNPPWNANICINFAAAFLDYLRQTVDGEGVWRIRRQAKSPVIEVFKMEETGHGDILSDEFKNWRIKLALGVDTTQTGTEEAG